MKRHIVLLITAFFSLVTLAQTKAVYGELTAFNQYPLQNIKVKAKKSGAVALTDSNGVFKIVCNAKDMIQVQSQVFESVNMRVNDKTDTLKRNLVFRNTKKSKELALAYGYMNKDDLTFAISNLQHENNDFCYYSDVFELIKGRFPGVQVLGDEERGKRVLVRGSSTIMSDDTALYVIDGMISDNIMHLAPCEIESISVLKDGSAAIYGSRAAGGVVLINTKASNLSTN